MKISRAGEMKVCNIEEKGKIMHSFLKCNVVYVKINRSTYIISISLKNTWKNNSWQAH